MTTAAERRDLVDENAIFDWRFTELRRAGYPAPDAFALASAKDVDVRLAERLLEQGCPPKTALGILL